MTLVEQHRPQTRDELALLAKHKQERIKFLKERELYEGSLFEFVKAAWSSIDSSEFSSNWAIESFCDHLECVTRGQVPRLLANYPPRASKPVWEEEWVVEKSRGRIRLKDVAVGDFVLNAEGTFGRVAAVHLQGVLPLLALKTDSGRTLHAAPDHPILTTRGWLPLSAVRTDDFVGVVTPLSPHGDEAALSANEARLIGYLVGDGSLKSNNQPRVTTISEEVSKDIEAIATGLGFFTRRRKTTGRNCWDVVIKSHPKRWNTSRDGEAPFRAWLNKYDLTGKDSYTKRVPAALLRAPQHVIAEFIGAYWSCDGYISVRGPKRSDCAVGCDSVSRDLLCDIQHLLTRLGIFSRLRRKEAKLKTKRQGGDTYVSWSLQLAKGDDLAKFAKVVRIVHEKSARFEAISGNLHRSDFDRPLKADPVISVDPAGEGICRCLTVEGPSPTFSANDIAVHNTTIASICWIAWTWAQSDITFLSGPQVRFLCGSYNSELSLRIANKCRRLIESPWYQKYWGDRFKIASDQNSKSQFDTTAGGSRIATSVHGSLLGLGGDIICIDDPHNTETEKVIETDTDRKVVASWFQEVRSTRLNNPKLTAIVLVMQRLHEEDLSGVILDSDDEDWTHLMIPMEFDPSRRTPTVVLPQYDYEGDPEPWTDPRTEEGELMWPERFGHVEVNRMKSIMGPYLAAGRLQQAPVPKGGGILMQDWWQLWDQTEARSYGLEWSPTLKEFPPFELVCGSLDTNYGEKEENDFNALTIWGIWIDRNRNRRGMLMYGWAKRLKLNGTVLAQEPGEPVHIFKERQKKEWGLVEWVADTCKRYKVQRLLIEDKTRGRDVANEINRLYAREKWGVQLINPVKDKVSRTHGVVPLFTDGCIWAPHTTWSQAVIKQSSSFPKGAHDDLHDTVTQFINWARENEILVRADEMTASLEDQMRPKPKADSVADHYGV